MWKVSHSKISEVLDDGHQAWILVEAVLISAYHFLSKELQLLWSLWLIVFNLGKEDRGVFAWAFSSPIEKS